MKEKPAAEPIVEHVKESDEYYGIQIMGLGRKLKVGDPALKGLDVRVVEPSEGLKVYRYIAACSDTQEGTKAQLSAVRKKFPDAFMVKVSGSKVTRIK